MSSAELQRAQDFQAALDERAAECVVRWEFGTALLSPSIVRVWDANYCRLENAGEAGPGEIAEAAAEISAGAGLPHVSVVAPRKPDAARLSAGLRGLGFDPIRHVSMALRERPARPQVEVEEVSLSDVAAVEREIRADDDPDPPELTAALAEITRRIHTTTPSRWLAARDDDGQIIGRAWLLERDGVAQIEDVATAPFARGRGLARAIVSAAALAALDSGADLVFVVADADETTPELYRKLGFEPLGITTRFVRKPPAVG